MAGNIELSLVVEDKGSAEIARAAQRAISAFDQVRSHAVTAGQRITGAFATVTSGLGNMLKSLVSIRGMLNLIAGIGAIYLIKNVFESLGARSETLSARFQAIGQAIGTFFNRIIDMIGRNPALLRALDGLAWWINDMAARLPDIEDTVRNVINWVVEFVQTTIPRLWGYLQQFIQWIKEAYQTTTQLVQSVKSWLGSGSSSSSGESKEGTYANPGVDLLTGESYSTGNAQASVTSGGNTVNYNFQGAMSRSDVVDIINEADRQAYRD